MFHLRRPTASYCIKNCPIVAHKTQFKAAKLGNFCKYFCFLTCYLAAQCSALLETFSPTGRWCELYWARTGASNQSPINPNNRTNQNSQSNTYVIVVKV